MGFVRVVLRCCLMSMIGVLAYASVLLFYSMCYVTTTTLAIGVKPIGI